MLVNRGGHSAGFSTSNDQSLIGGNCGGGGVTGNAGIAGAGDEIDPGVEALTLGTSEALVKIRFLLLRDAAELDGKFAKLGAELEKKEKLIHISFFNT